MCILCVGEILWDRFAHGRHLGGAAFNVAAHARRAEADSVFVSAVGDDEAGREALVRARGLGVDTRYVRTSQTAPTGTVDVQLQEGQPDYVINRPAAYDYPALSELDLREIGHHPPQTIYFGTLAQTGEQVRTITRTLLDAFPKAERFYDVNLRKDCHSPELIEELLTDCTIVKLNHEEQTRIGELFGLRHGEFVAFAEDIAERFALQTVCVTRGERGCALWREGESVEIPGIDATVADAVGAGDAFSAMLMTQLNRPGGTLQQAGVFANRLGTLVASRSGAIPAWTRDELIKDF
ncbi:MAG: carbohydrate kinase family protein [Verrucomicrobiota bacterium]